MNLVKEQRFIQQEFRRLKEGLKRGCHTYYGI